MTEGDCQTMDSVRRDVDRDIMEELKDKNLEVSVLYWHRALKLESEGTLREVIGKKLLSDDGVHLTPSATRTAAVFLCHRLLEGGDEEWSELESEASSKRIRLSK